MIDQIINDRSHSCLVYAFFSLCGKLTIARKGLVSTPTAAIKHSPLCLFLSQGVHSVQPIRNPFYQKFDTILQGVFRRVFCMPTTPTNLFKIWFNAEKLRDISVKNIYIA